MDAKEKAAFERIWRVGFNFRRYQLPAAWLRRELPTFTEFVAKIYGDRPMNQFVGVVKWIKLTGVA